MTRATRRGYRSFADVSLGRTQPVVPISSLLRGEVSNRLAARVLSGESPLGDVVAELSALFIGRADGGPKDLPT
jgi:hypothetical protein